LCGLKEASCRIVLSGFAGFRNGIYRISCRAFNIFIGLKEASYKIVFDQNLENLKKNLQD